MVGLPTPGGECVGRFVKAFANYLAGAVYVGTPVKFHPDHGESGGGSGAYATHSRRAVHGCLNGVCYDCFNFFGRKSGCLGHHYHGGRVEVGEYVYLHAHKRESARYEQ